MNKMSIYFIIVPLLAFLLLFLNFLLSPHVPYEAKTSPYECGFIGYTEQTRNTFHIQFYNVAMLFLVFDIELFGIFPITASGNELGLFGYFIMMAFFFLLTIGFILDIGGGAISLSNDDLTKNIDNNRNTIDN